MIETTHPTRYPALHYRRVAPGVWRVIEARTGHAVGPPYRTQGELLADLDRYARVCGADRERP